MRISVLDQSPISEGSSGADALRHSIDLARLADSPGLLPLLGCRASRHADARVREPRSAHRTDRARDEADPRRQRRRHAAALQPAQGRGELQHAERALSWPDRSRPGPRARLPIPRRCLRCNGIAGRCRSTTFPSSLPNSLATSATRCPPAHPFARLSALPGAPETPDPWLLGSSPQSAIWAAELGLPYAFADFINPEGAELTARYRRAFVPSVWRAAPEVIVAVWVVCAESDEEARRLAASAVMAFRLLQRWPADSRSAGGSRHSVSSRWTLASSPQPGAGTCARRRRVVGSPGTVRQGIEAVAAEYQADEVMVVTITHDHAARCRSYELIAREFGLGSLQAVSSFVVPGRPLRSGNDAGDVRVFAVFGSRTRGLARLVGAARLFLLPLFLACPFARPFVLCGSGFLHGAISIPAP